MKSKKRGLVRLGFVYLEMQLWLLGKNVSTQLCNETLMRMFLVKWMLLVVDAVYLYQRGLSGRDGFLLQQKSSAAGFHSKLWNNDMGDDLSGALTQYNIRLRVRAEYLEHDSALREGVSSDKRQPLERQFELFSQANSLLRSRDLGSIVCDIKFTELDNLEAFWSDYLSGALLEALKGVFITDSLRMAAGTEGVRLLISVDQDDYEEGRMLLRARRMFSSSNGATL
ncbi:hypothetical protein EPR50_G00062550 [Perca flavescens]|uniref:TRADD-like N-terminal domain-containing protein n=2 Tax=Perca TaxID=8166 RepID=A0A484D8P3_PERFV|nr:hypothetical protein EPR50_G00062550 [Perca flavescens]